MPEVFCRNRNQSVLKILSRPLRVRTQQKGQLSELQYLNLFPEEKYFTKALEMPLVAKQKFMEDEFKLTKQMA